MRQVIGIMLALASSVVLGQVSITQSAAIAGGITPGDSAGFPVTLSLSGSYKLDSNLTPPIGVGAIVISPDSVALDLNGYSVLGQSQCTSGIEYGPDCVPGGFSIGILSSGELTTIQNGNVGRFSTGIRVNGDGSVVQDVGLKFNTEEAIAIGGYGVRIENARLIENGAGTVSFAGSTQVKNVTSIQNVSHGLAIGSGTIENVVSLRNGGNGVQSTQASVIKTVKTSSNAGDGLSAGSGFSLLQDINAVSNLGAGIRSAGRTSVVSSLTAANQDYGYRLSPDSCFWQIAGQENVPENLLGGGNFDANMSCFQ